MKVVPLVAIFLSLLFAVHFFHQANASSQPSKPEATTTSTSEITEDFPTLLWKKTNETSASIDPSIGDAVNIYRNYLDNVNLARESVEPLPELFMNDLKQTMNKDLQRHLSSICNGLESISPKDNPLEYKKILSAIQLLVQRNRKSSLTMSLLGITLVGGGREVNGENSDDVSIRALRRSALVTNKRLKKMKEIIDTLEKKKLENVNGFSAYSFVSEYFERERRVYGRTLNLMGRLLFDLGEWKHSIAALESAVELDDKIPEAFEWLARAYDRDARPDDFFKAWHKALIVDPWASDRNVWPVFCVTIKQPDLPDTPRLSINREKKKVMRIVRNGSTHRNLTMNMDWLRVVEVSKVK